MLNTSAQITTISDSTVVELPPLPTLPTPTLGRGHGGELSNTDSCGLPTDDGKEGGSSGSNLREVDQTDGAENEADEGESLPNTSGGIVFHDFSGMSSYILYFALILSLTILLRRPAD